MLVEASRERRLMVLPCRETSHRNGKRRTAASVLPLADTSNEHVPICIRHADVAHDDVRPAGVVLLTRLADGVGLPYASSWLSDEDREGLACVLIILDKQHVKSRSSFQLGRFRPRRWDFDFARQGQCKRLPTFVVAEFRKTRRCAIVAHGFAAIRCGG